MEKQEIIFYVNGDPLPPCTDVFNTARSVLLQINYQLCLNLKRFYPHVHFVALKNLILITELDFLRLQASCRINNVDLTLVLNHSASLLLTENSKVLIVMLI